MPAVKAAQDGGPVNRPEDRVLTHGQRDDVYLDYRKILIQLRLHDAAEKSFVQSGTGEITVLHLLMHSTTTFQTKIKPVTDDLCRRKPVMPERRGEKKNRQQEQGQILKLSRTAQHVCSLILCPCISVHVSQADLLSRTHTFSG